MTEADIQKNVVKEYRRLLFLPAVLAIVLAFLYMLVELFYNNMLYNKYLIEYVLFQIIILFVNIVYYSIVKNMVLKTIIKSATKENEGI